MKLFGKNNPMYGKHHSERTKQKIREKKLGKNNAMFGKHHSEVSKLKIKAGLLGKKHTKESKQKMRENHADCSGEKNPMFGKHHSKISKQKIREGHLGKIPWNKGKPFLSGEKNPMFGKHHSEETKHKIQEKMQNEKHPNWKGDDVQYDALHDWVRRHKPKPDLCEACHLVPPLDVANISGEYKRDIGDFRWICRRCHQISDGRLDRLKTGNVIGRQNAKKLRR